MLEWIAHTCFFKSLAIFTQKKRAIYKPFFATHLYTSRSIKHGLFPYITINTLNLWDSSMGQWMLLLSKVTPGFTGTWPSLKCLRHELSFQRTHITKTWREKSSITSMKCRQIYDPMYYYSALNTSQTWLRHSSLSQLNDLQRGLALQCFPFVITQCTLKLFLLIFHFWWSKGRAFTKHPQYQI